MYYYNWLQVVTVDRSEWASKDTIETHASTPRGSPVDCFRTDRLHWFVTSSYSGRNIKPNQEAYRMTFSALTGCLDTKPSCPGRNIKPNQKLDTIIVTKVTLLWCDLATTTFCDNALFTCLQVVLCQCCIVVILPGI